SAGLGLARRGAASEAKPLLQIAASNRDGSYASLTSAAQLALSSGDLLASLALEQDAYQRYHQPETAAAIGSLYFALGRAAEARRGLKDLLPQALQCPPHRAD